MEDTHGGLTLLSMIILNLVLILIIMEDTHGGYSKPMERFMPIRLNPYYNGRYSWRTNVGLC